MYRTWNKKKNDLINGVTRERVCCCCFFYANSISRAAIELKSIRAENTVYCIRWEEHNVSDGNLHNIVNSFMGMELESVRSFVRSFVVLSQLVLGFFASRVHSFVLYQMTYRFNIDLLTKYTYYRVWLKTQKVWVYTGISGFSVHTQKWLDWTQTRALFVRPNCFGLIQSVFE